MQEIYSSASGYNRLFRCERYGRIHVLKTLQTSYVGSRFHEQALHKEFAIGYQLEHPHICRTLGWEQVPGLGCCIVMEYIDGMTLKAFMQQGKLTPLLARKLIAELCGALKYMHSKQIVHRDLKPDNDSLGVVFAQVYRMCGARCRPGCRSSATCPDCCLGNPRCRHL